MIEVAHNRWWRCWRMAGTALCFAVFGLGGLLLNALGFPLLRCLVRHHQQRAIWAKALMHYLFRFFVGLMRALGVLRLEVRGIEKLQRPGLLIVANHPSLIDVVFLIAMVKRAGCVVKSSLRRNFYMRAAVHTAGYLCNDSGAGLLEDALQALRQGDSLIVFPEGSRTPLLGALPLQRGAAHVAVRGRVGITPVRIRCQPAVLTKGMRWYGVPAQPPHFVIEVGDDIRVDSFVANNRTTAIATRELTRYLTDYFSLEIARAAA
jgi:1-acyl-sn-glycerol-3-phosphate acyltransferase